MRKARCENPNPLRQALLDRAQRDHESTSAVNREALRRYLNVA